MGRGDIKTKKGKIFSGSFGKSRPAKSAKKVVVKKTAEDAPVASKKTAAKKKA
jgi:30S ribosomal protein S31